MENRKPISAGEVASILAVWAVAILGCKNALSAWKYESLPQYFTDLMRGDSPLFGFSEQLSVCIAATFAVTFIIFKYYNIWMKIVTRIVTLFDSSLKNIYVKFIYALCIITLAICILFIHAFSRPAMLSIAMILAFGSVFTSDRLAITAKFSLLPSFILIFLVLIIPPHKAEKKPYMISTTCEGLETLKVISAVKVGNFVKVTTESDTFLINISTITQILPIKDAAGDAAKPPQPAEPQ
ncbi:hypothetical protein SDC9_14412 [bioreactor metagenome]|uniref:Uncharacterized protein n=1 Tax=bioreactor metagenome TaxID=1076179 RepID=A0A644TP59_9ZZZZ|nr:hypothetical protein [Desulfovibrio desulfuricans]MEA4990729.1 hypothetical protein [Desulfovibrio desulfuricans]